MPVIKPRKPKMSLEQRSVHLKRQREQRIRTASWQIKARFGRSERRVTLDAIRAAFPTMPWDILKPAARLLADSGEIKYNRAIDKKSALRRAALEQLLRTSKRKLKRTEIVRMLAEHYDTLKDPLNSITKDVWGLDEKLLGKIVPEQSNEDKIKKIRRAITKDPNISNGQLARIAGVSERELSYMLAARIPKQLKTKRVWHGFSAEQRNQQNTAILMGVRRSLTMPNIVRNIRILSDTELSRKRLSDRIKDLTGYTHSAILAQNAIIVEDLRAMKSPNEIAWSLRAQGHVGLDEKEIHLRINALGQKAAR